MSEQLPIRFDATRGCPQQTVLDIGGRRFTLTLLASAADVAALRSTDATDMLVAGRTIADQSPTVVAETPGFQTWPMAILVSFFWWP